VLRNVNSGAFEVYDIVNSQIAGAASLGSVGLEWQLGGFGAEPPTERSANSCKRWPVLTAGAARSMA
jgi:hypothetical protein